MRTLENNAPSPAQSKRPSKTEERVYLDDEQLDFLSDVQRAQGFKYRSEALRYCINQEQTRTRRRQTDRAYRQRQRQKESDRHPTGTP